MLTRSHILIHGTPSSVAEIWTAASPTSFDFDWAYIESCYADRIGRDGLLFLERKPDVLAA